MKNARNQIYRPKIILFIPVICLNHVSVITQMLSAVFTHVAREYVTTATIMANTVRLTIKNNNNNSTYCCRYDIVMCTYPFITRFSTFYLCFQAEAVDGAAVWWWVARVATNLLWISSFWTCWTGRGTRNAWNAPTVTARCPTNATAGTARYCASPTFTGKKIFSASLAPILL